MKAALLEKLTSPAMLPALLRGQAKFTLNLNLEEPIAPTSHEV
jgi:hypothetical protein